MLHGGPLAPAQAVHQALSPIHWADRRHFELATNVHCTACTLLPLIDMLPAESSTDDDIVPQSGCSMTMPELL